MSTLKILADAKFSTHILNQLEETFADEGTDEDENAVVESSIRGATKLKLYTWTLKIRPATVKNSW